MHFQPIEAALRSLQEIFLYPSVIWNEKVSFITRVGLREVLESLEWLVEVMLLLLLLMLSVEYWFSTLWTVVVGLVEKSSWQLVAVVGRTMGRVEVPGTAAYSFKHSFLQSQREKDMTLKKWVKKNIYLKSVCRMKEYRAAVPVTVGGGNEGVRRVRGCCQGGAHQVFGWQLITSLTHRLQTFLRAFWIILKTEKRSNGKNVLPGVKVGMFAKSFFPEKAQMIFVLLNCKIFIKNHSLRRHFIGQLEWKVVGLTTVLLCWGRDMMCLVLVSLCRVCCLGLHAVVRYRHLLHIHRDQTPQQTSVPGKV